MVVMEDPVDNLSTTININHMVRLPAHEPLYQAYTAFRALPGGNPGDALAQREVARLHGEDLVVALSRMCEGDDR